LKTLPKQSLVSLLLAFTFPGSTFFDIPALPSSIYVPLWLALFCLALLCQWQVNKFKPFGQKLSLQAGSQSKSGFSSLGVCWLIAKKTTLTNIELFGQD